jgi:crotonobetainyl-CoA:carnitine CoA-transferase CaiB-like acyl-CoA transferase
MDDAQVHANGLLVDVMHATQGSVRMVGSPIQFSETPTETTQASPTLGADTDTILADLGYTASEIEDLRAAEVIR